MIESEKSGSSQEQNSCCTPSTARSSCGCEAAAAPASASEDRAEMLARMVDLPGGTFLMGTESEDGFPADGEGPVRTVTVRPFLIDREFRKFVNATGYRTEAERFGWSFVFCAHIPHKRFAELVEDRDAAAPWWCKVRGARWDAPEGPGSSLLRREDHPVVHVSWNDAMAFTRWSGQRLPTEAEWSMLHVAGWSKRFTPGAISSAPMVNIAATSGRETFRMMTGATMDTRALARLRHSHPPAMAFIP